MKGTGRCPRKLLIAAVGRLAPVVVTKEYLTSRMHSACLERIEYGKDRILTCGNKLGLVVCQTGIDRDTNGSANIGQYAMNMLKGHGPPRYLFSSKAGWSKAKEKKKTKKNKGMKCGGGEYAIRPHERRKSK